MKKLALVLALASVPFITNANNLKDNVPSPPKTKLEQFSLQTGVVIIRGFHKVGTVNGLYGTRLNVQSKEFTSVADGTVQYGITIEAFKENGKYDKQHTTFIDYDEIDSLVAGIDYVAKIDNSVTKMESFQADYSTKGELKVSVFSTNDSILAAFTSGEYSSVTAYYSLDDVAKVKDLIIKAKEKIDKIK